MKPKFIILLFLIAVIVPFLYSNWGLTESSEARYAEIGREMYRSGDYLHPTLLGIGHYHKPPVTYYLTALGYSIAGVNEYGARLFLQVSLLFQLLLVYLIADLLYKDKKISLAATLIYFSFPIVQIAAKNLTTDAYLTTFIFASIYFFIRYRQKDRSAFLLLFYLFSGFAFLTKGPVAVLPQFIFAVIYLRTNKLKFRFGSVQIFGLIFFLLISASWFIVLLVQDHDFLNYFVEYQLVKRVSGNTFNRSKPFWYYFLFMPAVGLPAFLYFFDKVVSFFKKQFPAERRADILLLLPFLIMFLVFSFSFFQACIVRVAIVSLCCVDLCKIHGGFQSCEAEGISAYRPWFWPVSFFRTHHRLLCSIGILSAHTSGCWDISISYHRAADR